MSDFEAKQALQSTLTQSNFLVGKYERSFGMMMPKEPEQGESALKVEVADVQETETGKVISWTVNRKTT